jgi:hypothetical protein
MSSSVFHGRANAAGMILVLCGWTAGVVVAADPVPATGGSAAKTPGETPGIAESSLDFSRPNFSDLKDRFPQRSETFDGLFSRPGSQSMPPVPLPSLIPDKRTRQLLDDQKNWVFITPDDVIDKYMSQDFLRIPEFGPDGKERTSSSALERFYERLSRGRSVTNKPARYDLFGRQIQNDGQNDSESAQDLNSFNGSANPFASMDDLSNPGLNPNSANRDALLDMMGLKNNRSRMTLEDTRREQDAHDLQLEAFKKALDFQSTPAPEAFNPAGNAGGQNFSWNVNSGGYAAGSQRNPSDGLPGAFTYSPSYSAIPRLPAYPTAPIAPGQPTFSTPLPTVTATRIGPPKPDFTIPQRKF